MTGQTQEIRLACLGCDREDYDGVTLAKAQADGWQDIGSAFEAYESNWWTHLGYCPDCQRLVQEEKEKRG